MSSPGFATFREFYPYYLQEHSDRRCRRLHFIGSTLVLACVVLAVTVSPWWLLGMPLAGYGCAWIGHFAFEKNRPATFKHPLYSLIGDWVMYAQMLRGRVSF
ncbi:MAG: Mpo1-like protein [Pseudomarimonas sp.]